MNFVLQVILIVLLLIGASSANHYGYTDPSCIMWFACGLVLGNFIKSLEEVL